MCPLLFLIFLHPHLSSAFPFQTILFFVPVEKGPYFSPTQVPSPSLCPSSSSQAPLSVMQLPHSQPYHSPSFSSHPCSLLPHPSHPAPETVFRTVSPHSCHQPLLRSPYFSGVPSILHLCPTTLVLYLSLILVSNTPFLAPSSSSLLLIFFSPHLPYFLSPSPSSYLHLPNPGSPFLLGSPIFPSLLTPISPSQNSISGGPISSFPHPNSPIPILIWPRVPNLPILVSVFCSILLVLISLNSGPYLTTPSHPLRPQYSVWIPVVFPGRKEIRRLGGAAGTLTGEMGMVERVHEVEGSEWDLDREAWRCWELILDSAGL